MPSLVPIVRCRETPTNWKVENRSIARLELVYRSTLTYVVFIRLTKDRCQKKGTTNAFRSGRHSRQTDTQSCTCTFYAYSVYRTHRSTQSVRVETVSSDWTTEKNKYELRIPFSSFLPFPGVSFFFFFLEKSFRR